MFYSCIYVYIYVLYNVLFVAASGCHLHESDENKNI